jgi:hypothetical protein
MRLTMHPSALVIEYKMGAFYLVKGFGLCEPFTVIQLCQIKRYLERQRVAVTKDRTAAYGAFVLLPMGSIYPVKTKRDYCDSIVSALMGRYYHKPKYNTFLLFFDDSRMRQVSNKRTERNG